MIWEVVTPSVSKQEAWKVQKWIFLLTTWQFYFSSDFDVFINEFLSKIPFRNMHSNYYHFWHKRGKKGGRFQMSNFFVFHPILRHFLNILMGYRWAIKKIGILFFKEVWRESKFWNFTYLEDTEIFFVVQFCCVLFLWIYCIESFPLYAARFPLSLSVLGCLKKMAPTCEKKVQIKLTPKNFLLIIFNVVYIEVNETRQKLWTDKQ